MSAGAVTAGKIDFTTLKFGNYSATEQDTGFKWIDGKAIYKKTYTGTITVAAATGVITNLETIAGLTNIIDQNGWYYYGSGTVYQSIPSADRNGRWASVSRNGTTIRLFTESDSARTAAPYAVTVWYTK